MSKLLTMVARAAARRTASDEAYRAAIQAARNAGHTMPEIGAAAGLTKQGVRYLLHPDPRKAKS